MLATLHWLLHELEFFFGLIVLFPSHSTVISHGSLFTSINEGHPNSRPTTDILGCCYQSIAYSSFVASSKFQSRSSLYRDRSNFLFVYIARLFAQLLPHLHLFLQSALIKVHCGMLTLVSGLTALEVRSDLPPIYCATKMGAFGLGLTRCHLKAEGSLEGLLICLGQHFAKSGRFDNACNFQHAGKRGSPQQLV